MKEKQYLSSGEVAKALGVSVKTVQRWDQAGLITVVRTIHNQRRIPATEITRLTRGIGQPRCVIYARVSSSRQEPAGNLERQSDRLRQAANTRGYLLVETIAEQASSLNEKRRGMKKLFSLIEKEVSCEVNAHGTSQYCCRCGARGERFSRAGQNCTVHRGGKLFRCPACGYEAQADFNASVNVHHSFWKEWHWQPRKKPPPKKPSG